VTGVSMTRDQAIARLLGHPFRDPTLLAAALTHRSARNQNRGHHNERLEFLGDGVLDLVIAEALYQRLPQADEGQLSRLRANLVNRDALAELARGIGLGEHLRLGGGELKSGGRRRDSILADALEALFGAVYLDGGYSAARDVILRLYAPLLDGVDLKQAEKDPKTRLQEYLQGRGLSLPAYRILEISGQAHEQRFRVACRVDALDMDEQGEGTSRRRAEQAAAAAVLQRLERGDP